MREIEFLYDFGSPNAWFVHRAIPACAARGTVTFRYVPVLLGGVFKATGNQSPMQAYGHVAAKRDYDLLEIRRFIQRHGIAGFTMNPHFPVNTLLMMRGAVAAESLGCAEAYIEAMFAGMWEQGLKLDDPEVWAACASAAGLDAAALGAAASTGIPLTHRDHAQMVSFVTGHRKQDSTSLDWVRHLSPHSTLVVYMGLGEAPRIARELMAHGHAADTPLAVVASATTPEQRVLVSTLASVQGDLQSAGLASPALLIVGSVVNLHADLSPLIVQAACGLANDSVL